MISANPPDPKRVKPKNLTGKRILITRARDQASQFANQLKRLGAEVIEFPTIEIVPPVSWQTLDQALNQIRGYDWIIFTSANGVDFFFQRFKEKGKTRRHLSDTRLCAIGPATAAQLEKGGLHVDFVPKEFVAEAILDGLNRFGIEGKRICLARAKKARDVLPKGLREKGARVDIAEVYRTVKPKGASARLKELLGKKGVDVIAFTSSSTVSHFAQLLGKRDLNKRLRGVIIACIGPVTSRTARQLGMKVHVQPREYTIPGLTQAIAGYFTTITRHQTPIIKK